MLDDATFHDFADDMLESIFANVDAVSEEYDVDSDLLNGILSVKLPDENGEYVLNKHEPSRQIWLSSPFTGAYKFKYDENREQWLNDSGDELIGFFSNELLDLANVDVKF